MGKTNGGKIVEAARSDVNTVQKRKFGLFRSFLGLKTGIIVLGVGYNSMHHSFGRWLEFNAPFLRGRPEFGTISTISST